MEYARASVRIRNQRPAIEVRCIYSWDRGDLTEAVIGSSGPKDYIKNEVFALFESDPTIQRVLIVRAGGPFFALRCHQDGSWRDAAGKDLVVEPA